ncbi:hypothetical protein Vretimale_13989, partial [Volvox reticuliferus]
EKYRRLIPSLRSTRSWTRTGPHTPEDMLDVTIVTTIMFITNSNLNDIITGTSCQLREPVNPPLFTLASLPPGSAPIPERHLATPPHAQTYPPPPPGPTVPD